MKTIKGFTTIVKSTVTKVSVSSKKAIQLLLLSGFLVSGITSSANASPWYQERDGIFGEIKYAEFCNTSNLARLRIIAEAGSRTNRVYSVRFKMYSRYYLGANIYNQPFAITSSEAWRHVGSLFNNISGNDRRFYDTRATFWPLQNTASSTPVRLAIHVRHSSGTTVDLGKVIDFGIVPLGQCKVYNDGNIR